MDEQNKKIVDTTTAEQDEEQISFKTENLRSSLFVSAEMAIDGVFKNNPELNPMALQMLIRSEIVLAINRVFNQYFYFGELEPF